MATTSMMSLEEEREYCERFAEKLRVAPISSATVAAMRDREGNTYLMWAILNNQTIEKLVQLIRLGVDVNAQNFHGHTALYLAIAYNDDSKARMLLALGANVNVATLEGATPLMLAASLGNERLVQLLLSHGAYVNSQDEEGDTALHMAIRERHAGVVKLLLSAGADPSLCNEDGESSSELAACLEDHEMMQCLVA